MNFYLKLLFIVNVLWVEGEGQSDTRRIYGTSPKIVQASQVFVTSLGRNTNFDIPCEAEATPPPTIEWRFNGGLIDRNGTNAQPFRQMINGRLYFRNVGRLEVGYYQCKAINHIGEDKVEHTLVVSDYLESDSQEENSEEVTPTSFTVVETTEISITIRRTNLSDSNPIEIYYYADVGDDLRKRIKISPSMTEYILEELHCSTVYKISQFYDSGYVFYVRTKGLSLPPPPGEKFIIVGENNVSMNFKTWNEGNCPEWKFTIKYIPTILKGFGDWITIEDVSPVENYTISSLVSETNYTFEIYSSGFTSRGSVQVYKIRTLQRSNTTADPLRPEIHLPDKDEKFNLTQGYDFHYSVTCWVPTNATQIDWLNSKGEKVGEILNTSSRIYQEKHQRKQVTATKLYIDKVNLKDSGTFTCLSSLTEFKNSFNFKVMVEDKKVNKSYSEQFAYEGTEYCLKCFLQHSEYRDNAEIAWRINNITPTSPKYTTNHNFDLCIQNVTKQDSKGKYFCRNISPYDKLQMNIRLNVLSQPWLTNTLETKIFNVYGTTVNLTCITIDTNPPASFMWLIENAIIETSDITKELKIINKENMSVLQIVYTNTTSPGPYTCQAKNSVGVAEMQFLLHQAQKPPPPILHLSITAFDGIRVKTKDNLAKDSPPIVEYVVQVKLIDDRKKEEPWKVAKVAKTSDGFIVHKLMSETKYLVRAASKNSAKLLGDYSLPIAVNTDFIYNYSLPIEFKELFAFSSETNDEIYGNLGEWVNLTCVVFADPQAVLHWRKDNKTVEKTHAVKKLYPKINMSILSIYLKHNSSFGEYVCGATKQNVEEIIQWPILVKSQTPSFVNTKPISLVPQAEVVFMAQNGSFFVSCQDPSSGTTDMDWFDKNNKRIRNYSTASPMHIMNHEGVGVDLIFKSVQENDVGFYSCFLNGTKIGFQLNLIQD